MEAERRIDRQEVQADVRATLRKLIGGPGHGETVQSNEPFITWIGRLRVGDYRLGEDGDYHFEGDKC